MDTATSATGRSTADLVSDARSGDELAYQELILRYHRYVWSVVRSFRMGEEDAHDAVQMTWLRLVENLRRLRDPERLGGWLATTASRECLRIIRQRDRERPEAEDVFAVRPDERFGVPEDRAVADAMTEVLWARVADLPPRGQALLSALTGQDAPGYAEISRRIGMPIGSIGPTRGRYLVRLRRLLEDCELGADAWA